ncbi:MAG TPA: hypothetical protein VFG20_13155 [Planctomycetaceae bacterium]|nr:hypothetical protein [Planctomycetaceae bacterium]
MASRPPTVRSLYRSTPPPEFIETVEPEPTVAEIPPVELAAISIIEPVMEPALSATDAVNESPPMPTAVDSIMPVEQIVAVDEPTVEPVEAPAVVLPKLEILSLERVPSTGPLTHPAQSWRHSISRWAYRWWLWTREAFRQCFPMP